MKIEELEYWRGRILSAGSEGREGSTVEVSTKKLARLARAAAVSMDALHRFKDSNDCLYCSGHSVEAETALDKIERDDVSAPAIEIKEGWGTYTLTKDTIELLCKRAGVDVEYNQLGVVRLSVPTAVETESEEGININEIKENLRTSIKWDTDAKDGNYPAWPNWDDATVLQIILHMENKVKRYRETLEEIADGEYQYDGPLAMNRAQEALGATVEDEHEKNFPITYVPTIHGYIAEQGGKVLYVVNDGSEPPETSNGKLMWVNVEGDL